jgi:hypothetical protein
MPRVRSFKNKTGMTRTLARKEIVPAILESAAARVNEAQVPLAKRDN